MERLVEDVVRAGKIAEMREYLDTELVSNVFGRKQ
jgi:ketosteroid isomerase-like protein